MLLYERLDLLTGRGNGQHRAWIAGARGHQLTSKARKLVKLIGMQPACGAQSKQLTVAVSACRVGGDSELL